MGHYAKVVNGKVTKVIVAQATFFDNFVDSSPGKWIKTSYNTRGGVTINQIVVHLHQLYIRMQAVQYLILWMKQMLLVHLQSQQLIRVKPKL